MTTIVINPKGTARYNELLALEEYASLSLSVASVFSRLEATC